MADAFNPNSWEVDERICESKDSLVYIVIVPDQPAPQSETLSQKQTDKNNVQEEL